MGKRVFMFPGQGSQYIGMGKEFYENFDCAKKIFDKAGEITGLDVAKMCFEENDKINITEYTQICMLTVEAALFAVLKEKGIKYDITAGLSLGEYAALIASGAMSMESAFDIVRKRGIYMQNAVPEGGGMSAVLGLDPSVIEEVCNEVMKNKDMYDKGDSSLPFTVSVANYNNPKQTVITGRKDAVSAAGQILADKGALKVVELNVSGPFHSKLLEGAGEKLAEALKDVELNDIEVPYIANVNAEYVTDKNEIKELLKKQVSSSVRWQQSLELMIKDGVDEFIEIGPGHTLTGFVKKIDRSLKTVNIDTLEDFNKFIEAQAN
ncbi:MAG: ACP S-malonyltransferase [Lachnospiraceae bacterium]|nr:ACP S-malonyltransferase [Lachnospiraceae bacterium]